MILYKLFNTSYSLLSECGLYTVFLTVSTIKSRHLGTDVISCRDIKGELQCW